MLRLRVQNLVEKLRKITHKPARIHLVMVWYFCRIPLFSASCVCTDGFYFIQNSYVFIKKRISRVEFASLFQSILERHWITEIFCFRSCSSTCGTDIFCISDQRFKCFNVGLISNDHFAQMFFMSRFHFKHSPRFMIKSLYYFGIRTLSIT